MKRWIKGLAFLLLIAFGGLSFLYFHRDTLLLNLSTCQIGKHAQALFGTPLTWEEKRVESGTLIIEKPIFCHGHQTFTAKELKITPRWLPHLKGVSVKAEIIEPNLALRAVPLRRLSKKRFWLAKAFRVKWECSFSSGTIDQIPFSGWAYGEDSHKVSLFLSIAEGELQVNYRSNMQEKRADLYAAQFPADAVASLLLPSGWEGAGGLTNGSGRLHFPNKGLPWLEGEGEIGEFCLVGPRGLLECQGILLNLDPKPHLKKRELAKLTSFEELAHALNGNVTFKMLEGTLGELTLKSEKTHIELEEAQALFFLQGELNGLMATIEAIATNGKERQIGVTWAEGQRFEMKTTALGEVDLLCASFKPEHTYLLKSLLFPTSSYSHTLGNLSLQAKAQVRDQEIQRLWIKDLSCSEFGIDIGGTSIYASELIGHLSFPHLKKGWERECGARLLIEGGQLLSSNHVAGKLNGELLVDSGSIERLKLEGFIDGMSLHLAARPLAHARGMQCHLSGNIKQLIPLWPNETLQTQFGKDPFSLELALEREGPNITGSGTWKVGEDSLPFGFALAPQKKPSFPLPPLLEHLASHCLAPQKSRFPIEIGPAKVLAFEQGWVEASRVSAAKFIQPLLKDYPGMTIYGTVDLKGTFKGEELKLNYEGYNMRLEAPLFRITTPHVGDLSPQAPAELKASHYYNVKTRSQEGYIPLTQATYIEKGTCLAFSHIAACVDLRTDGLKVPDMKGVCEGVKFVGSIDLFKKGGFPSDLKLHAKTAEGPLSGALQILNKISPSPLWKLETLGSAYLEEEGFDMRILFLPEKAQVEASMKGGVLEGKWENGHGFSIEDLTAKMAYQHDGKKLEFDEVAFSSHFQKEGSSYLTKASSLIFENFPQGSCLFTLEASELAKIHGEIGIGSGGEKRLHLHASQFGGIKPNVRLCTLGDKTSLKRLKMCPEIHTDTLGRDLSYLQQITGFPLGSATAQKLHTTGIISGEVTVDGSKGSWKGQLTGNQLTLYNHPFEIAQITACGSHKEWEITAKGDSLLAQAKLEGRNIVKGEASYGDEMTCKFKGHFEEGGLIGAISHCQLPTSSLTSIPYLKEKGWIKDAAGLIELKGPFKVNSQGVDAHLNLALQKVAFSDIQLNHSTPLHCTFQAGLFKFENITLAPTFDLLAPATLQVGALSLQIEKKSLSIENLVFDIPSCLLPKAAALSEKKLPIDPAVIFKEKSLVGTLNYTADALRIAFADGEYSLFNHSIPLSHVSLEATPQGLALAADSTLGKEPIHLAFEQLTSHSDQARLTITPLEEDPYSDPLTLSWACNESFCLTRIEGDFPGINLKLTADHTASSEGKLTLFGAAELNPSKALAWLPKSIEAIVRKTKLRGNYQLFGRFELPDFTFSGDINGRHLATFGYSFERLWASLYITSDDFAIHSLSIQDPYGRCVIDRLEGRKSSDGLWTFEAPLVRINDVQPTVLKGAYKPYGKNKPLMITKGEIHHLKGTTDPATWSGSGSFSFQHPPKRDAAHTPFALPDDLLGILGLDFQSLIPAQGTVRFTIEEGRCTISRFADVLSRGHRSQFFLAQEEPSYVDFDGNISLRVRTKQYNLILKITELFTVAIGGTLDKPTFRLQKPNSKSRGREG